MKQIKKMGVVAGVLVLAGTVVASQISAVAKTSTLGSVASSRATQREQGQERGPRPMPMGPQLLLHPKVQKELKLSKDQVDKLTEMFPRREGMGGGPDSGPPRPPQDGQEQGNQGGMPPPPDQQGGGRPDHPGGEGPGGPGGPGGRGGAERFEGQIKSVLSTSQLKRFKEISLQVAGPLAIGRPEVSESLGLSDDHANKVREIAEQFRPQHGPQGGPGGDDQQQERRGPPSREMREQAETKILAVLTDDQKSKWTSMQGKAFSLKDDN